MAVLLITAVGIAAQVAVTAISGAGVAALPFVTELIAALVRTAARQYWALEADIGATVGVGVAQFVAPAGLSIVAATPGTGGALPPRAFAAVPWARIAPLL